MKPYASGARWALHCGDSAEILPQLSGQDLHACVTDPPYGLRFMGRRWDCDVPTVALWQAVLAVLPPGAHLLAFAGTRTQHRMTTRIEDAGFEIRDMLAWVYGSGFPKSHNLEGDWEGWGTALKPALEPITLARAPLAGTVAANVLAHRAGAMNVDACRVGSTVESWPTSRSYAAGQKQPGGIGATQSTGPPPHGRWPANLLHDGSAEVLAGFPDARSNNTQDYSGPLKPRLGFVGGTSSREVPARTDITGSAARFFYCAKASKEDRDEGLDGFGYSTTHDGRKTAIDNPYLRAETVRRNHHPTVKPTALMRWLCRLVTPPGGTVLDPFAGSGSTGKAALHEGFRFIGIERDPEHCRLAAARLAHAEEKAAHP